MVLYNYKCGQIWFILIVSLKTKKIKSLIQSTMKYRMNIICKHKIDIIKYKYISDQEF